MFSFDNILKGGKGEDWRVGERMETRTLGVLERCLMNIFTDQYMLN